jgi:hypothetical protein
MGELPTIDTEEIETILAAVLSKTARLRGASESPHATAGSSGSGLTARVTVDVVSEPETDTHTETTELSADGSDAMGGDELAEITGVDTTMAEALRDAGYESVSDIHAAPVADLAEVKTPAPESRRAGLACSFGEQLATELKAEVSGAGPHKSPTANADPAEEADSAVDSDVDVYIDTEESAEALAVDDHELTEIASVTGAMAEALRGAGYESVEDVRMASRAGLADVRGFGSAFAARVKNEAEIVAMSENLDTDDWTGA